MSIPIEGDSSHKEEETKESFILVTHVQGCAQKHLGCAVS
jgi:hypothetical protein